MFKNISNIFAFLHQTDNTYAKSHVCIRSSLFLEFILNFTHNYVCLVHHNEFLSPIIISKYLLNKSINRYNPQNVGLSYVCVKLRRKPP